MRSKKIRTLVYFSFFTTIMIILSLTPLGFVPIGPLRATTLHLPVILAGMLFGKRFGAGIGLVFGFLSFMINTFQPTITSFVFTPFYSLGNYSGNILSLVIVFAPRIFLGYFSGFFFEFLKGKNINRNLAGLINAALATIIHSVLVLGMIALFFGNSYASAKGMDPTYLITFIITILTTNSIAESLLAGFVCPLIYQGVYKSIERTHHE
ncbi:MAG: ECF transporter S component [Anaerorhabdus sp.]